MKKLLALGTLSVVLALVLVPPAVASGLREPEPALEVEMVGTMSGREITYSITLANPRATDVHQIYIAGLIPTGTSFVEAVATPGQSWFRGVEAGVAVWLSERVPAKGRQGPFKYRVRLVDAQAGPAHTWVQWLLPAMAMGTAQSARITPFPLPERFAGLPLESFRNDWPFDPPLPDHLWMNAGAGRLLFLHFDKPVAEATMLLYIGEGIRGRFYAEDQPEGGTTGFTHFHRLHAPTVDAGHGGAPGDEGYWLRHIAVGEFEMMGMKVKPGIDFNFMPTVAPVGLSGQWRNEWPFDPPLPDHLWMDIGGGRIMLLHYDKPVTDPTKMLLYVGEGVRGRFCSSDQPHAGKTGYTHFHRFRAPTVEAGHGGAPGDEGYWLRHVAVAEFEMMGMKVKPGIDFNFMPTNPPQCEGAPMATSMPVPPAPMPAPSSAPTPSAPSPLPQIPPSGSGSAAEGERTFSAVGCIGCHTIKGIGGNVGPNLSVIGARRDAAYISQSIREPQAYVVPGYPPVMPSPDKMGLSEQDIANLVAFLTSLR